LTTSGQDVTEKVWNVRRSGRDAHEQRTSDLGHFCRRQWKVEGRFFSGRWGLGRSSFLVLAAKFAKGNTYGFE
jgi:hypothetical protein